MFWTFATLAVTSYALQVEDHCGRSYSASGLGYAFTSSSEYTEQFIADQGRLDYTEASSSA